MCAEAEAAAAMSMLLLEHDGLLECCWVAGLGAPCMLECAIWGQLVTKRALFPTVKDLGISDTLAPRTSLHAFQQDSV